MSGFAGIFKKIVNEIFKSKANNNKEIENKKKNTIKKENTHVQKSTADAEAVFVDEQKTSSITKDLQSQSHKESVEKDSSSVCNVSEHQIETDIVTDSDEIYNKSISDAKEQEDEIIDVFEEFLYDIKQEQLPDSEWYDAVARLAFVLSRIDCKTAIEIIPKDNSELVAEIDREEQLLPEQYKEISSVSEIEKSSIDVIKANLDQKEKVNVNDADLSEWTCSAIEFIKLLSIVGEKKKLNAGDENVRKTASGMNEESNTYEESNTNDANNPEIEIFDAEDPLCDREYNTESDNQNRDEELKRKYHTLYPRIYRIMERSYTSSGVTIEELCSALRFVASEEMVKEILSVASWVVKLEEKYYFLGDLSKEVLGDNKNDIAIDTEHSNITSGDQYTEGTLNAKHNPLLDQDRVQLLNEQTSFSELLNVRKEDYKDETVVALNLSVRAANALRRKGWITIEDLLSVSPNSLFQCKNLGRKTFNEIVDKLVAYCDESKEKHLDGVVRIKRLEYSDLIPYQEDIIAHRWEDIKIQEKDNKELLGVIDTMALIDDSLLDVCVIKRELVDSLMSSLYMFYSQYLPDDLHVETFEIIATRIPADRLHQPIKGYLIAFTNNEDYRNILKKWFVSDDMTVRQYLNLIKRVKLEDNSFKLLKDFLSWLTFDLASDIRSIKESLYKNERDEKVLLLRSMNNTLEQVGKSINVTRQRIRQIESKVRGRFSRSISAKKIMKKIYAERGGNAVLTPVTLQEYFGDDTGVFQYLLRVINSPDYVYDSEYDVFIVEQTTLKDSVRKFTDELPDTFPVNELPQIIKRGETEYDLTTDIISKVIEDKYYNSGDFYHSKSTKLTLRQIYQGVLEEYYQEGIHVYDKEELRVFRKHVHELYGDVDLPENDRAITAGLCRDNLTILCGRGRYRLPKKEYIPNSLAKKIKRYIDRSSQDIFLTNTIFYMFQDELEKYGIDNKYYLQGVLRQLYGDTYYFRRDYIMKDAEDTNIYKSVQDYVKHSTYPVTKEDIRNHFPGITEIVLSMALADRSILQFYRRYVSADRIQFTKKEKKILDSIMNQMVFTDGGVAHIKDIYEIANRRIPYALLRNGINMSYDLLSVLRYMYSKQCTVSRPYIAKKGIEIGKSGERMHELINNESVIGLSTISDYAKRIHMVIPGILSFVEQYADNYLLINRDQIATYDYIGINKDMMKQIDIILQQEVTETIAIRELHCIDQLPSIKINWNEWLIYSIEKTISDKLEVATSGVQIRNAIPLIAPRGLMQINYNTDRFDTDDGDLLNSQNIENIDDLLEDFIEELIDDIDFDI